MQAHNEKVKMNLQKALKLVLFWLLKNKQKLQENQHKQQDEVA